MARDKNGVAESFNGKFREECLGLEWFRSRAEAKASSKHGGGISTRYGRIRASAILRRTSSSNGSHDQRTVQQRAGALRYMESPRPRPVAQPSLRGRVEKRAEGWELTRE